MGPEFQQISDAWRTELAGRASSWCQVHPREDDRQWSAQQLVEHLVLALRSSARVLETRLLRGHPSRRKSTLLERALRLLILTRRRMPHGAAAPPFVRPGQLGWPPMDGVHLTALLGQELEEMDRLIARCEERFGRHRVATHFLLGPLRPDQWRLFHVIHCRHHLEQFHRIQREVGSGEAQQPVLIPTEN